MTNTTNNKSTYNLTVIQSTRQLNLSRNYANSDLVAIDIDDIVCRIKVCIHTHLYKSN